MDISVFITLFHIIGVALGAGGATVSDLLFFRALADKRISKDEFALLHSLGYILWAGLIILFLSGLGFVTYQFILTGSSTYLVSDWFWAKMTIVFVLFCNALMMHSRVFPFMTAHLNTPLTYSNMHDKFVLLAITGTVSITSWYSAMILGVTRGFDFSYGLIVNTYAVVVIAGILFAYVLFVVALFPKKDRAAMSVAKASARRTTPRPLVGILLALAVGMILVIAAWYGAKLASPNDANKSRETSVVAEVGESHVVCITENMPWFTPTSLTIAVGDIVIWDHCHNEVSHATASPSLFRQILDLGATPVYAQASDWVVAYTHTHAIMSVSGPESFASDTPVGHVYEGEGFMMTFTEPGTYEYISPTHPYMRGRVVVGESAPEEFSWPPAASVATLPTPAVAGLGEVWVALQFARAPDMIESGALAVVDTTSWQVVDTIENVAFHNPYQLAQASSSNQVLSTQWHSDRVVAIDRETRTVTDGEYLGNAPAHIVSHPNQAVVFVALHNENRVAVLDTEGVWLRDIIVPLGPHGLAVTNDGAYLAVVSSQSGEFALVDLATEQIVVVLELPDLPQAVVITPDDALALITSHTADILTVVDIERREIVSEIALAGPAQSAVISPAGESIWVTIPEVGVVQVIGLDNLLVESSIPVAQSPQSVAFGQNTAGEYYAYVTHRFARVLSVVDVPTRSVAGEVSLGSEGLGGAGLLVFDAAPHTSVVSDEIE